MVESASITNAHNNHNDNNNPVVKLLKSRWWNSTFLPLHSPALPFPSFPRSLSLPSPSSLPLEVGPLNPARESGERCKLPAGSGAEPQPKQNLVHLILKIGHLVATTVMIFPKINWKLEL